MKNDPVCDFMAIFHHKYRVNLLNNISVLFLFTCIETEIITSVKPGSSGFNSSNRVSVKVQSLKHKHNQVNTKLLTFEPLIQLF